MKFALKRWFGLIALVLFTGCASVRARSDFKRGETVEAEGWSFVDPHDAAGTRKRALADAEKKAVEKVAGVFLAASTRVDAAITVRESITANVRGYIRHYQIIDEKTEDGLYKIRIRAFVARLNHSGKKGAHLSSPPLESAGISVSINGGGAGETTSGADAASAIESSLSARGFKISASSDSQSNLQVLGRVRVSEIHDPRLGRFVSYGAKITLEALDPETKSVIWQQSQKASAIDVNADNASSQAIENAAALIGSEAADHLITYLWKQQ